ncbi:hypothetical protein OB955_04810 [Halobacteria archaeon AArc-m2/3/4]|uniref:Uncharacterized protein n=1 Tax=Natronoglomus mannanivorans TaxID=2979990 RepID=A0ABT2QAU0_9EURY|nr:hypothetical protein [Halobacteria archaeon AArc-m2/3/4]
MSYKNSPYAKGGAGVISGLLGVEALTETFYFAELYDVIPSEAQMAVGAVLLVTAGVAGFAASQDI